MFQFNKILTVLAQPLIIGIKRNNAQ